MKHLNVIDFLNKIFVSDKDQKKIDAYVEKKTKERLKALFGEDKKGS